MSLIDYVEKIKAEFPQIDRYFTGFIFVIKFYKSLNMTELRRVKIE